MWKTCMIALLLAGCVTEPRLRDGTERGVVIEFGTDELFNPIRFDTSKMAEEHCAKFGRRAKSSNLQSISRVAYDCIN